MKPPAPVTSTRVGERAFTVSSWTVTRLSFRVRRRRTRNLQFCSPRGTAGAIELQIPRFARNDKDLKRRHSQKAVHYTRSGRAQARGLCLPREVPAERAAGA